MLLKSIVIFLIIVERQRDK